MFGLVLRLFSSFLSSLSRRSVFFCYRRRERSSCSRAVTVMCLKKNGTKHTTNKVKERFDSVDFVILSSPTQLDWYELICDLKLLYFSLSCGFYLIGWIIFYMLSSSVSINLSGPTHCFNLVKRTCVCKRELLCSFVLFWKRKRNFGRQ